MFAAALAAMSPEAKLDPRIAALAVMDIELGKELKYRELPKHPKLGKFGMDHPAMNLTDSHKARLAESRELIPSISYITTKYHKIKEKMLPTPVLYSASDQAKANQIG